MLKEDAMRKAIAIAGFVVVVLSLAATAALGCGDKMLVLGSGVRFQHAYAAVHPASILLYMRQNSAVPAAVRDAQLQPALRQAGHKVYTVEDRAQLDQALKSGNYDLVLADLSDAETLEQAAQAAPSRPVVLPVVYKPTKAEEAAAGKNHQCVVKAPNKAGHYLAVIDEAMELKLKGNGGKCRRVG